MSAPKASELNQDLHWESGWEEHKHSQFLRLARLPLSDKLSWLEQAHRVVLQLSLDHSSNINTKGRTSC
jgi:hypothetical protein